MLLVGTFGADMSDHRFKNLCRIRRLAHGFDQPEDRQWLAEALQRYLLAADDGLTLEDAFEIATPFRARPWWRVATTDSRDIGLRELARLVCPGASLAQRSAVIFELLNRYAKTKWPSERGLDAAPADAIGTPREIIWHVLKLDGELLSERQLRRILAGQ